jgi:hypothetical protein
MPVKKSKKINSVSKRRKTRSVLNTRLPAPMPVRRLDDLDQINRPRGVL